MGEHISEEILDLMMKEADTDQDGKMNFEGIFLILLEILASKFST